MALKNITLKTVLLIYGRVDFGCYVAILGNIIDLNEVTIGFHHDLIFIDHDERIEYEYLRLNSDEWYVKNGESYEAITEQENDELECYFAEFEKNNPI